MTTKTTSHYYDRDLSWLSFNHRVLEEAKDSELPVYERIKFLAIFSSNLDEFFRIRVAAIRSLLKLNKKKLNKKFSIEPADLLSKIKIEVGKQQEEYGKVFREIVTELGKCGIILQLDDVALEEHRQEILHLFRSRVMGYLQPVFITGDPEDLPFLVNRKIYLAVMLEPLDRDGQVHYAVVNIPSDHIGRYFLLPELNGRHYIIALDDIIRQHIHMVFPGYHCLEARSIKLNRDDDLNIQNEYSGDLVGKIRKQLKKRGLGAPSRFLYDGNMSPEMLQFITAVFKLRDEEVVKGGRYHNMYDLLGLPNPAGKDLQVRPLPPIKKAILETPESIFDIIDRKDLLLHFPYHSYDYVLRFFNEASLDPYVTRIRATFYRVAPDSVISSALISAARNGKKVSVFFEVKARFDELNNLEWAGKMEEAGIKITYSIPGIKVHAKVALVDRQKNGRKIRYGFYGTGNFNEKTAGVYADQCLLTRNRKLNDELVNVFAFLNTQRNNFTFNHLLVSQFNIVERLVAMIDREINCAKSGKKAHIILKLNNIEDPLMIDKLYEASQAGVEVQLIIRSICRVVPGVKGLSENIKVIRLLDRYLEHARVLYFRNGGNDEIFMGSSDWMIRNLYHRIEVVFPVFDEEARKEILQFLAFQLRDSVKARILDKDHHNNRVLTVAGKRQVRAQTDFYKWLSGQESKVMAGTNRV